MDGDSTWLIAALVVLVALSAYFSATETAFSSLNALRLKSLAAGGNRRAAQALKLAADYDKLLSTILIGNNVVNIGATSIATVLFVRQFGDMGASLSTVVMTVLVLIFGEVTPKSMAKEAPESWAMIAAPALRALLVVLAPLNFLFSQWKRLVARLFKIDRNEAVTEEDVLTMVDEAQQGGGLNEQESRLIHSVIAFDDLEARDILTPRVDVEAVSDDATKEEIAALFRETGLSRLPVYTDSIDNIVGILNQKDFYNDVLYTDTPVSAALTPAQFVVPTIKLPRLLKLLQQQATHIAVVVDEFGGTDGIVTLEDILEELVGEIWDEHDTVVEDIVPAGEQAYRVRCTMDWDHFARQFPVTADTEAATVGGWVVEQCGRIPRPGHTFTAGSLVITTTKADRRRVEEVLVRVRPKDTEALPADRPPLGQV